MSINYKMLLVAIIASSIIFTLWILRPVEIIDVHKSGTFTDIIVKNFPITDKGKIKWWNDNKKTIEKKYKFLPKDKDENYTVIIWGWKGDYK